MKLDPLDKRKKSYYHADEKHPGYEVRDIGWHTLLWIGALIVFGVAVFVIVLDSIFSIEKEREVYKQVLQPESVQLRELRAEEHKKLHSYGQIDAQKGIYQIPIDRAMELIAEDNFKARQQQ